MVYRSDCSDDPDKPQNVFRNDGSFLEMFKKLQGEGSSSSKQEGEEEEEDAAAVKVEEKKTKKAGKDSQKDPAPSTVRKSGSTTTNKPVLGFVGKRRGGRVLPTGKVKKVKSVPEVEKPKPTDAWALYLEEVKRYKETTCEEDGKTRPLVK